MYRVLSPGGWIQLNEITSFHSGPKTESLWSLAARQYAKKLISLNLLSTLPDLLATIGFVGIRDERRPLALYGCSTRQAKARKCALTWFSAAFEERQALDEDICDIKALMKATEKEWSCTEGSEQGYHIVCAQKPPVKV